MKLAAASVLESSILIVNGRENSATFDLEIGREGSIGGKMRGRLELSDDGARLVLSMGGSPTDPIRAIPVRDALDHRDLLTVYYASGHVFTQGRLYRPQVSSHRFPNWKWMDFTGFDVAKEKPGGKNAGPAEIHDGIGKNGDQSLFSWVYKKFSNGWLTCDDGSGELADFIHVSSDDFTVSFIHVKAAENNSQQRKISASAYEVVTSQAVKNTYFMNDEVLVEHLKTAPVPSPATWADGTEEDDRSGLVEAILERDARNKFKVVIVQPHVREVTYNQVHASAKTTERPSADLLRLRRLENLLNGGRPTMTGMGADLYVYGGL